MSGKKKRRPNGRPILVDIDGVLGRDIFGKSLVGMSEEAYLEIPPYILARGVLEYLRRFYRIVIGTGRSEQFRKVTERWLKVWGFPYDELRVSPARLEKYAEYVKYKRQEFTEIDPILIIEDSDEVLVMARELGFATFQIKVEDDWGINPLLEVLVESAGE